MVVSIPTNSEFRSTHVSRSESSSSLSINRLAISNACTRLFANVICDLHLWGSSFDSSVLMVRVSLYRIESICLLAAISSSFDGSIIKASLFTILTVVKWIMVVLPGFEPGSPAPKAGMIDHYTTGLCLPHICTGINSWRYGSRSPYR